jgi:glutathione S-transferase
MRHTLHVINGSHPCAAVLRAMELKGIDVKLVEYSPPFHAPILKLRFGYRRVPILQIPGGETVRGSRQIVQRLEAIQPYPQLYPNDHIAAIETAERWGDEVLQVASRRLLWAAVRQNPRALASFQAGSHLPRIPTTVMRVVGPVVAAGEYRLNGITPVNVEEHVAAIPSYLDKLDEFNADGAFGTSTPTGADLQIGSSLQLLRAIEDLRPLIDAHPIAREVARWLPTSPGSVPAGALPKELVALAVNG